MWDFIIIGVLAASVVLLWVIFIRRLRVQARTLRRAWQHALDEAAQADQRALNAMAENAVLRKRLRSGGAESLHSGGLVDPVRYTSDEAPPSRHFISRTDRRVTTRSPAPLASDVTPASWPVYLAEDTPMRAEPPAPPAPAFRTGGSDLDGAGASGFRTGGSDSGSSFSTGGSDSGSSSSSSGDSGGSSGQ